MTIYDTARRFALAAKIRKLPGASGHEATSRVEVPSGYAVVNEDGTAVDLHLTALTAATAFAVLEALTASYRPRPLRRSA